MSVTTQGRNRTILWHHVLATGHAASQYFPGRHIRCECSLEPSNLRCFPLPFLLPFMRSWSSAQIAVWSV